MHDEDQVNHAEHAAVDAMIADELAAELGPEPDPCEDSRSHAARRVADPSVDTWVTGQLPDLSGVAQFVVLIRAPGDPERLPRDGKDMGAEWRRKLMKQPVEGHAAALREHFADGQARTMNRAGVEMLDKTADVLGGTTFEDALWLLVGRGELEFTMQAPVLFRICQASSSFGSKLDGACAPEPVAPEPEPAAEPAPKRKRAPKTPKAPEAKRPRLSLGRLRTR